MHISRLRKMLLCSGIYTIIYILISWTSIIRGMNVFRNCEYICLADMLCYVEYCSKVFVIAIAGVLFVIVQKDEYRQSVYIRHRSRIRIVASCIERSSVFAGIISIISAVINIVISTRYVTYNMTWLLDKGAPHIMTGSPLKSQPETWCVIIYYILDVFLTLLFTFMIIMLMWWISEKAYPGYILVLTFAVLSSMKSDTLLKYLLYSRMNMRPFSVYITGLQWKSFVMAAIEIILLVMISCLVVHKKDFIKMH